MKQNRTYLAPLTWPSWPAHRAGPAHWPGASRPLPLPVGRGGRQRTRAPWRHATSLPACVPRHRDASGLLFGAASNPWTPSLIPFSCSPSRSAPRTRTEPSPPTPFAAATIPLSPPRRLRELRSASLYLLNEPRGPGRAASPPSMSSSTSDPPAIFVKFAGSGPSPASSPPRMDPL